MAYLINPNPTAAGEIVIVHDEYVEAYQKSAMLHFKTEAAVSSEAAFKEQNDARAAAYTKEKREAGLAEARSKGLIDDSDDSGAGAALAEAQAVAKDATASALQADVALKNEIDAHAASKTAAAEAAAIAAADLEGANAKIEALTKEIEALKAAAAKKK